tara:strand:+ start:737 stop:1018 length:282 start_codon:yes stop_codon:yes gene_type:complete
VKLAIGIQPPTSQFFTLEILGMEEGVMRKKTRIKKTFTNAVETTIKRFSKIKENDRYALLEKIDEWIFCDYDEIEINYLKNKKYEGKKSKYLR